MINKFTIISQLHIIIIIIMMYMLTYVPPTQAPSHTTHDQQMIRIERCGLTQKIKLEK